MTWDAEKTYRKAKARQDRAREAFYPSDVLERLVLQVLGGLQTVHEEITMIRFHEHGPNPPEEFKAGRQRDFPKHLNRIARKYEVDWPYSQFAEGWEDVRPLRNQLAHLLFIDSITGEFPNRTLAFWNSGNSEFVDDTWSKHEQVLTEVTEGRLREALGTTRQLLIACRFLNRKLAVARGD